MTCKQIDWQFPLQDLCLGEKTIDVAFLNSKGFGGNNATACVIAPSVVEKMIANRYGKEVVAKYHQKRAKVRENIASYEMAAQRGEIAPIYKFGENMIDESKIVIKTDGVTLPGYQHSVNLSFSNPYSDMVD